MAIDRATGQLASVERSGRHVSLANGPRIVEGQAALTALTHRPDGDGYVVEATYDGALKQVRWRLDGSGWLELSYVYVNPGRHAHLGVTFDYPEAQVTGLKWLGRGPYRVWKNRMQGNGFDVWQKAWNDTRTGADWTYPEFKGHHADLYWAVLQTKELPITVVTDTEDLFLRVLTPRYGENPTFTAVAVPGGRPLLPPRDRAHRHEVRRPGDDGPRGPAERGRGREPDPAHGRLRRPPVLLLRRPRSGRHHPLTAGRYATQQLHIRSPSPIMQPGGCL